LRTRNLTRWVKFRGSQVSDAGRGPRWAGGPLELGGLRRSFATVPVVRASVLAGSVMAASVMAGPVMRPVVGGPVPEGQSRPDAASPSAATDMKPPTLPPFAGALVNFDRHGARVAACVDRAAAPAGSGPAAPRAGAAPATGAAAADAPASQAAAPGASPAAPHKATRIWIIEREMMQELLLTGGMCDPVWAPDGRTLAATGPKGLYVLEAPRYEPRVLAAAATLPASGSPGSDAGSLFKSPAWSPSGKRLAFVATSEGKDVVQVVDTASGAAVFKSAPGVRAFSWGRDDTSLTIDGQQVTLR
jgi:WD40-like Beta Propeller Repeat